LVVFIVGGAPGATMVCQLSITMFDPSAEVPVVQPGPHGRVPGAVSTACAEARSAGIHIPSDCSDREALKRPSDEVC
jgi:hypothetical protein